MTANGIAQTVLYMAVLIALVKPLGAFMARVLEGERTFLHPVLAPLERVLYRVCGVDPEAGMSWRTYAAAMLLFNGLGLVAVYAIQRLQGVLPLNPQGFDGVSADSSFNTAVSFATNTNWQGYGGEVTMSYFSQMLGLTVQNFVSAAVGLAVAMALVRGIVNRRGSGEVGIAERHAAEPEGVERAGPHGCLGDVRQPVLQVAPARRHHHRVGDRNPHLVHHPPPPLVAPAERLEERRERRLAPRHRDQRFAQLVGVPRPVGHHVQHLRHRHA